MQIIECNVIEVVSNELRNTDLGNNVIASAIPGRSLNAKKREKFVMSEILPSMYVKSKGFFPKYILLLKRTFMKRLESNLNHFLLQNELQKEIGSFSWLLNLSKRVLV